MAQSTGQYRYFLFSNEQYKLRKKAELSLGKTYIPGRVLNKGRWYDYTEISQTPSNNRYADAKIVAEGYLDRMTYRQSTSEWTVRS